MVTQKWVPFALLSSYKMFCTFISGCNQIRNLLEDLSKSRSSTKFHTSPSIRMRADTYRQTERNDEVFFCHLC